MHNSQNLKTQPKDRKDLLQGLRELSTLIQQHNQRIAKIEEITEKRQRPKNSVSNTHRSFVESVYENKCPCCMKPIEFGEVDHFNSRAWSGIHDTWLICQECNRGLYNGDMVRAEILPCFIAYQRHLKAFMGGEQLTFLNSQTDTFLSSY
ncbi:hypothetical protein ACFL7M_17705 [Thermodesulfobacteriota bacterium]